MRICKNKSSVKADVEPDFQSLSQIPTPTESVKISALNVNNAYFCYTEYKSMKMTEIVCDNLPRLSDDVYHEKRKKRRRWPKVLKFHSPLCPCLCAILCCLLLAAIVGAIAAATIALKNKVTTGSTTTLTTTTATTATTTSVTTSTTSTVSTTTTTTTTTSTTTTTTTTSTTATTTTTTTTTSTTTTTTTVQVCSSCMNTSISNLALAALYTFDSALTDSSSNGNTLNGNYTAFVTGYINQAVRFTSANAERLTSIANINFYLVSFTIEFWFYWTSNSTKQYSLFGQYESSNYEQCLFLDIRYTALYFGFFFDDLSGNTILSLNHWYHAAFVFDYSNVKKYIYLDG
ncbi:unnamed protein product, partial [Didymodactylos carnosus]